MESTTVGPPKAAPTVVEAAEERLHNGGWRDKWLDKVDETCWEHCAIVSNTIHPLYPAIYRCRILGALHAERACRGTPTNLQTSCRVGCFFCNHRFFFTFYRVQWLWKLLTFHDWQERSCHISRKATHIRVWHGFQLGRGISEFKGLVLAGPFLQE